MRRRPGQPGPLAGRAARARSIAAEPTPPTSQVDPGNTELERGTSLLVVARFNGGAPADASLVVDDQAQTAARRGMTRSLEDPTFAGRVESVETDLAYRVEFDGKSTDTFHVHVFEYPELERTDAKLVFPALHVARAQDRRGHPARHGRRGDRADLLCRLNKDVATARLVDTEGKAIALAPRRGRQPRLPRDHDARRPQALQASSWSTRKGAPTS